MIIGGKMFGSSTDYNKDASETPLPVNPYKIAEVVKPDLMWDTQSLFALNPEIKAFKSINDNLDFFKFKSFGYTPKNLNETWVFAAIGVPDSTCFPMPQGGYPAVILVHGGNGEVFPDWVRWWNQKGYVALAFDTYSNQLSDSLAKEVNPEGGVPERNGPLNDSVDDKLNSWTYHVVASIILSNNVLRARSDVNPNLICLTGISWGGVATSFASAVDKRFACFAPVYGAGYLYEDSKWTGLNDKVLINGLSGSDLKEWIKYYDPSSYLTFDVKPTLFVAGINDNCFSVKNRQKSARLVKGKKFFAQHSDLGHGHWYTKTPEIYEFFQHVLFGKEITIIDGVTVSGGVATLRYTNKRFDAVKFVYTTSKDEDSHKWEFISETVEPINGVYSYTLPIDTVAFAFEVYHSDISPYCVFSTEIYLNKQ